MPKRTKAESTTTGPNPLFVYHPPTEEQKPVYDKLHLGFLSVLEAGKAAMRLAKWGERSSTVDFDAFTAACSGYHDLIVELCPESADRTAAIRCLRLARNAVNDVLCGARDFPHGVHQAPFHNIFETELIKCRYQANASIALDGKL